MKRRSSSNSFLWPMGLLATIFVAGCGSDGGGGAQLGSMSASLTDAPACGFDAVNVTVDKVRVHQSSSADPNAAGWTNIALVPPRKINLLDLNDPTQPNFALESLGITPLGAGQYTQVRLVLIGTSGADPLANSVVLSGTSTEISLDTPSAVQSGIKLIHPFTVNPGQRTDLLLDFDACKSIVKTGNGRYKLKPVIQVIPFELNGIQGVVDPTLLNSHVVVSAQTGGNIVRSTMPNATTGEFLLARLAPGNYDVVITADNRGTAVIAGVPVATSTSITPVSTSGSPITLNASAVQSINGTMTLDNPADNERDEGNVSVAAKQTLNGGPTVTVKSGVATVNDNTQTVGDYSYALSLPIAAPALGQYSATLPIALTAALQSAVAKIYTVESSAQTPTTLYSTQTPSPSPADVTVVQTQNFTLTP